MGLLSDDYIKSIGEANNTPSVPQAQPAATATPVSSTTPAPTPSIRIENPTPINSEPTTTQPTAINSPLSEEDQTARFGGPIGSQAYLDYQANRGLASRLPAELGKVVGINLPDQKTWDSMSRLDQIATTSRAALQAGTNMLINLPKAAVQGVASVGLTAIKPFYNLVTGKPTDMNSLANEPVAKAPWLGEVPTLYQAQHQAEAAGMGPLASRVFAGSSFLLNTASVLPVGEALANTFRPRGNLSAIDGVRNTTPIRYTQDADGVFKNKVPSSSEYYTLRNTDAKQFGGTPESVKWKMSPTADNGASIAVVKSVKEKPGTWVKTEFGMKKVEQGDFGPEVKLYSTDLKDSTYSSPPLPNKDTPIMIPKEPLKGFENKPITDDQLATINQISGLKGVDPAIRDAVITTMTGKTVAGELTQKEFTKVAQTLATFGEKYGDGAPKMGPGGYVQAYLSPQRHYFDYVEDTHGIPLKSAIYNPMEEGFRLAKTLETSLKEERDQVLGKFRDAKYAEERRLIDSYMRGNTDAILKNDAIDPAIRGELVDTADKFRAFYDKIGPLLNVGKEAHISDYSPNIRDIGGVEPKYKNLDNFPAKDFFAKFKKKGSLNTIVDDPLVSSDIYIREGSRALHLGKTLEDAKSLLQTLPKQFSDAGNSYIQEKLGHLGQMEQFVDSFVPAINKKFGINLPSDASRQGINYALSSLYSGLVATPSAIFKQTFQLPTFVYARLGTEHAGEALLKSFIPSERERIAKLGFLNDIALPYGEELAKDFNPVGKVGNMYKSFTQTTLKPLTAVDNDIRIKTFLQAEMQWNHALNDFNAGKIQWPQLEQKLDFGAFSATDRNTMRQALTSGDHKAAFNLYMREILDETSFPYRTGAGARIGYGLGGKLATGLLNYTIESTNVLTRWARTGQWDKLIRFAGNAAIVNNTLKETFGFDFGDTLYQKFTGVVSPAIGLAGNFYGLMKAWAGSNKKEFNANADEIVRTLKSGLPLGVFRANLSRFMKSYEAGADENGQYPIYDTSGKLISNGDFHELFYGTLMGFPTNQKIQERDLYNDILNRQTESTDIQQQVNQLLREGKYDEMEALVNKTGIFPSQNVMESSYVPRTVRSFQSLRAKDKAEFAPRVFPQSTPAQ
jgi:hypothetical protein